MSRSLLFAALAFCVSGAASAQDGAAALYAPSVWDLRLGAHASQLPAGQYIDYACGTNGGPPSLPLAGWSEFSRCTAEAGSGLREVYFQYDDQPEYVAKARGLEQFIDLYQYTSVYAIPVILSGLFDQNGFLVGVRMVTDPRVPVEIRERGQSLANFLMARYDEAGWRCADLARRDGETEYAGAFVKRRCGKTYAKDGQPELALDVERHYYRKPGQYDVDPVTRIPTEGQFESTSRFELMLAHGIADAATRLAALPPPGTTPKDLLIAKARNCPGCDLRGVDLKRADLTGANLAGADLSGANLHAAILAGANLAGAKLVQANINRADIKRANLEGAVLINAMMYETRLDAARMQGADLTEGLGGRVQLIGADLRNAKMRDMDLREARLNDVRFASADLSGTWLHDAQLSRADLTGAVLVQAVLWRTGLVNAKLAGADLREADLYGANLRSADLSGANFGGARLTAANLSEALVVGAQWTGAELPIGFDPN